jgi:hypothetical protein
LCQENADIFSQDSGETTQFKALVSLDVGPRRKINVGAERQTGRGCREICRAMHFMLLSREGAAMGVPCLNSTLFLFFFFFCKEICYLVLFLSVFSPLPRIIACRHAIRRVHNIISSRYARKWTLYM